ncbi:hypothetical protein [Halopelagius fulvigenes]|uniref:Uncharacterized protein n=1 Tax=Halopelagius fulvigenes TaxID=1198324 RepID=A0ABD5TXL4_9EURY
MSDAHDDDGDDDESPFGLFGLSDTFKHIQKTFEPVRRVAADARETSRPVREQANNQWETFRAAEGSLENVAAANETVINATASAPNAMPDLESLFASAQKLDSVTAAQVDGLANTIGQAETPTRGVSRRRRRTTTAASEATPVFGLREYLRLFGSLIRSVINTITTKRQRELATKAAIGIVAVLIIAFPRLSQIPLAPVRAKNAVSTVNEWFPGDTD